MIKKIRKRFIIFSFSVVAAVILAIVVGIDLSNYFNMTASADGVVSMLVSEEANGFKGGGPNDRPFPDNNLPREARFAARYFLVETDASGAVTRTDFGRIASVKEEEVASYLKKAKSVKGFAENFRYARVQTQNGYRYVFLDCEKEIRSTRSFILYSVIFTVAGLAAVAGVIVVLSKNVLAPVAESYAKQKRFITDAGHELKTPLTVISANAELLELETGENEWLDSIKGQVQKLSKLTKELVFLSRMDEGESVLAKSEFSLKNALEEVVEGFKDAAFVAGKTLEVEAAEISVQANEEMIRRVIGLLTDNAIKYAERPEIRFSLTKEGNHALLEEKNAAGLPKGAHPELFERFYRPDGSRTTATGGHGVGLSVVESIVTAHGGSVACVSDGSFVTFALKLPIA